MNPENSNSKDNWQPCDEGAIRSAASSQRDRHNAVSRRQFFRNVSVGTVTVAGAGFAAWSLFGEPDELNPLYNSGYPGGIACSEVQRLLDDYINQAITDAALVESIDVHLAECHHCSKTYKEKTRPA